MERPAHARTRARLVQVGHSIRFADRAPRCMLMSNLLCSARQCAPPVINTGDVLLPTAGPTGRPTRWFNQRRHHQPLSVGRNIDRAFIGRVSTHVQRAAASACLDQRRAVAMTPNDIEVATARGAILCEWCSKKNARQHSRWPSKWMSGCVANRCSDRIRRRSGRGRSDVASGCQIGHPN